MSKHQLKKALAALGNHLHRDAQGQTLLATVSREANDIRTDRAKQMERAEAAQQATQSARAAAAVAVAEADAAQLEVKRLEQKVATLQRSVNSLQQSLEIERGKSFIPTASNLLVKDLTMRRLQAWTSRSIREMGSIAAPLRRKGAGFSLFDLLPRLDQLGFSTLGRLVALRCLMHGSVSVSMPEETITSKDLVEIFKKDPGWKKFARTYCTLWHRSIDHRTDKEILELISAGSAERRRSRNEDNGNTTADVLGPAKH